MFRTIAIIAALASAAPAAPADTIRGSAVYRERIAMPPGTLFEAVLEDVSVADAPSVEIGRAETADAGQPPYDFTIDYDPENIDPRHAYSVRARLTGPDGRLWFTTDTVAPVITRGAGTEVELLLVQAAAPEEAPPPLGAHGLRLPSSFTGTLPCADCEGIAHHLDLWPDQAFHLRREWLGGEAPRVDDAMGHWSADPGREAIVLHGTGEPPLRFEAVGPDMLRLLAQDGSRIESDLPYELTAGTAFAPTEITGAMEGMFTYFADAALFEVCVTGRRFPVAMEGGYLDTERAYLTDQPAPGEPLMMLVEGALAMRPPMEGAERLHLVIDRMIATQPGRSCARSRAQAELVNTYWKLRQLDGAPVTGEPDRREPHMILQGGASPSMAATMGCNRMMGGYETTGAAIAFGNVASTMMACPDPLAGLEQRFAQMLERVDGWQVAGQSLILSADGAPVAVFEAVYLP